MLADGVLDRNHRVLEMEDGLQRAQASRGEVTCLSLSC